MIFSNFIKVVLLTSITCIASRSYAQSDTSKKETSSPWSIHFQTTVVDQYHGRFTSPFAGRASLKDTIENATTITSTLFIGCKLWKYGSIYFNPEIAGGEGLSGGNGIAGFPNGEVERVGNPTPLPYVARAFYQQSIALPGTKDTIYDNDVNQINQHLPNRRITISAGKFSLEDFFDNNPYAHDPRSQFMNWALMANAAWDYPANTRGYTSGIVVQLIEPKWHINLAGTQVPTDANGPNMDNHITQAFGLTFEAGLNYHVMQRIGGISLLLYMNQDRAGNYAEAVASYENGNLAALLHLDSLTAYNGSKKYGAAINWNHPLGRFAGLFVRAGWNDGRTATWAFTPVDMTASLGFSLCGKSWHRDEDAFGIAMVENGISQQHLSFLQAGGYDFMIGDGKLIHYAPEMIVETFYSLRFYEHLFFSPDLQLVVNPAYNADRGPVGIVSARVHAEF